jgi:hypothetical protein
MASLLIPPSVSNMTLTPRWLARRVAMGLWQLGYLVDRSEVDRSMGEENTPSVSVTVPDPGAINGKREFLITVEEL